MPRWSAKASIFSPRGFMKTIAVTMAAGGRIDAGRSIFMTASDGSKAAFTASVRTSRMTTQTIQARMIFDVCGHDRIRKRRESSAFRRMSRVRPASRRSISLTTVGANRRGPVCVETPLAGETPDARCVSMIWQCRGGRVDGKNELSACARPYRSGLTTCVDALIPHGGVSERRTSVDLSSIGLHGLGSYLPGIGRIGAFQSDRTQ